MFPALFAWFTFFTIIQECSQTGWNLLEINSVTGVLVAFQHRTMAIWGMRCDIQRNDNTGIQQRGQLQLSIWKKFSTCSLMRRILHLK